ncbi:signal peptidase I [Pseudomonadota bacterium]|nr:signal peptidase I [Pseudomonadota bacterium]|tara:strand:- start:42 stop:917 length:876 start_codon:yes stop_codon:yes gene_type:complete
MFGDPIFLLSLLAVFGLIGVWIYQVLQDTLTDQSQQIIYIAGLSSSLVGIYRIFVNAGDLGSVLLIGSVICLIILMVGVFTKNTLLKTTGKGWFVPVFLIFVLRTFIYEPYQIPSGSMIPGLKVGDFILVNKHSYGLKVNRVGDTFALSADPEYGDVVVFIPPHVNVPYIKRLIGKPGDTIGYLNKKIYVNGKAIKQELISTTQEETFLRETLGNSERIIRIVGGSSSYPEEFMVPANHYFVMGDNRDNSSDSRFWGFVPKENLMGTGELIWMSWECWTCLPSFERAGFIQ